MATIRVDNSIPGLADFFSKIPEKTALNFERNYLRRALEPYKNEFANYLKTNYSGAKRVRPYSRGQAVATTGRMANSITRPKTVRVKDPGQSKEQLRVLGFFYAKKQQDLPKSKKNPALRPNVGTVMGWLNFGTLPHSIGKNDITSKNVISRINYFEKKREKLIAHREMIMNKIVKATAKQKDKLEERLRHANTRYSELIARRGGRGPGQGHDTGKLVAGVTARKFVTRMREKVYNNLNKTMLDFITKDVDNFISGINKGNYLSGLVARATK